MATAISHTALALAIGICSCTTSVAMNTTLNYIAFPAYNLPAVASKQNQKTSNPPTNKPESSSALLLRQWALTYRTGHLVGPASVILSTAAFLYASQVCPAQLQNELYLAATSAGIAFPFTVLIILPVNVELFKRADALEASRAGSRDQQNRTVGKDASALIEKCLWYSKIRAVMPAPAILLAMHALYQIGNML